MDTDENFIAPEKYKWQPGDLIHKEYEETATGNVLVRKYITRPSTGELFEFPVSQPGPFVSIEELAQLHPGE